MNLLRLVSFDLGTMLHSTGYVIISVSCLGVRLMKVSLSRPHAELCENRGGRPGLPVLMSLMVSVHLKQH